MCDIYFPAFAKTMGFMLIISGSHTTMETSITLHWEPFAIESRFYRVEGFRAEIHVHYFNCSLGEYFILVASGLRL